MNDLSSLEERLEVATTRVIDAVAALAERMRAADGAAGSGAGEQGEVGALRSQNAELNAALKTLQDERARDVAELDALIDQLKPLLEEV